MTDTSSVESSHDHAVVTPLAGALGVRIDGVDLAGDSSDQLVDALQTILDRHLVIHLPDQGGLTAPQLLGFAQRWGAVRANASLPSVEGHPGIVEITGPAGVTTVWHHDMSHLERPPTVSIAIAREVPEVGGDTLWANQYLAYEGLSLGLRETLDGLFAVHEGVDSEDDDSPFAAASTSVHPVVVTHDRTGRRALYVDPHDTSRLDGWTEEESRALLAHLFRVSVRVELTCRHRWTVGDVVIWDNRATQHCSLDDAPPDQPRVLHRVAIAGDIPR